MFLTYTLAGNLNLTCFNKFEKKNVNKFLFYHNAGISIFVGAAKIHCDFGLHFSTILNGFTSCVRSFSCYMNDEQQICRV